MNLLCRNVVLATRLVALVVVDVLLFGGVGSEWQTVIGTTDVAFEWELGRFCLDLVNVRSATQYILHLQEFHPRNDCWMFAVDNLTVGK